MTPLTAESPAFKAAESTLRRHAIRAYKLRARDLLARMEANPNPYTFATASEQLANYRYFRRTGVRSLGIERNEAVLARIVYLLRQEADVRGAALVAQIRRAA